MGDSEVIERVIADPGLLRLPLVRYGNELTIGVDEEAWRAWHRAGDSPPGAPS
jgi:arsenate reductase-like glutaredoxin family protein